MKAGPPLVVLAPGEVANVDAEDVDAVVAKLSWRGLSRPTRLGVDIETGFGVAGVLKVED